MRSACVLVFALVACGGSSAKAPVAPAAAQPVASTHCYLGKGETTLAANGQVVDSFDSIAKRTLDPAASTIREEVAISGSHPGRYVVDMKVDGSKVTMKEASGSFSGDGELVGTAWEWSSWTTHATMEGGMNVTSTDTLSGDKLETQKKVEQNGQVMVTIAEHFTSLPCDQFDAKASEIAKH